MKNIKLFTLFFLASVSLYSQINPFLGIYDVDSCHLESPCSLIQLDTSTQNIWQIGEPQKPFFDTAYTCPNALVTDTINPYPVANNSYFDLTLSVYDYYWFGIIVGFRHKFQTDTLTDGGYIDVSYDNGQSWVNVLYDDTVHVVYELNTENLYSEQDTLLGGINGFSGNSNGWIYTRIQWVWEYPCDIGTPDTLMLRFHFISDTIQSNKDGWMIDNILISYADEGTAIEKLESSHIKIDVFPNPFDNYATISFNNSLNKPLSLVLRNAQGVLVKKINQIYESQFQLRREGLTSGLYILQLMDRNRILGSRKLIIN